MNMNDDEKSVSNKGVNLDNEAFKKLAGNLLKSEKSMDSIMQLATSLLKNDSLLNSIADRTAAKHPVSKEVDTQKAPVSTVNENKNIAKGILQQLASISQKLEDLDKNVSDLKKELNDLKSKVSKKTKK